MAFTYRLELEDGTPAEPATLDTSTPSWHEGAEIPLRTGQGLRVVATRPGEKLEDDRVLVVETA